MARAIQAWVGVVLRHHTPHALKPVASAGGTGLAPLPPPAGRRPGSAHRARRPALPGRFMAASKVRFRKIGSRCVFFTLSLIGPSSGHDGAGQKPRGPSKSRPNVDGHVHRDRWAASTNPDSAVTSDPGPWPRIRAHNQLAPLGQFGPFIRRHNA